MNLVVKGTCWTSTLGKESNSLFLMYSGLVWQASMEQWVLYGVSVFYYLFLAITIQHFPYILAILITWLRNDNRHSLSRKMELILLSQMLLRLSYPAYDQKSNIALTFLRKVWAWGHWECNKQMIVWVTKTNFQNQNAKITSTNSSVYICQEFVMKGRELIVTINKSCNNSIQTVHYVP